MTQAIDPWILSVRSITRLRVLALGLALVFGRSANGQEPPANGRGRPRQSRSSLCRRCPATLPSRSFRLCLRLTSRNQWLADIAKETDRARTPEFLETDGSSFTFAVRTAEKNRMIFESGLRISRSARRRPSKAFRSRCSDMDLPIGSSCDLVTIMRRSPTIRDAIEGDIAGNFGINAQQQIYYGFKYQVSRQQKEKQWQPTSAFLFQFHTPIASEQTHTQIRLGYAFGWTLPNGWIVDAGFRYGTDRELGYNYTLWAPSSAVKIPLGRRKRWYTQLEYFGIVSEFRPKNFSKQFVDTGLHYFITPNWEIGATVSFGINEQTRGTMVNAGTGIQF